MRVAGQPLRRQVARHDVGVIGPVEGEQGVGELACGAGRLRVHGQQLAQCPLACGLVAAKLREVRARLQGRRVTRPQFVQHGICTARGIRIAQVPRRGELPQLDLEAGIALEFRE